VNFLRIKYFLTLAEVLNFSKAADQLFMVQSVLSRQILAMEEELELTLFVRNNKNVSLTEAGEILYDGLRDMRWRYISLLDKATAAEKGFRGTIRIGALPGQLIRDFVPFLQSFEKQYANIKVILEAHNLKELRQRLGRQQLDFVFGASYDFAYFQDFELEVIGKSKVCLVLPYGHRWYNREVETLGFLDFKEDVFIIFSAEESPIIGKLFSRICKETGFSPKHIVVPDLSTLMLWLEVGRGIAPLDEAHVFSTNRHLRFLPIPELGYTELSIIWNVRNINACNKTFTEHIKDYKTKIHINDI
jgi:DNA-binding transcriptional LysR family regulator